jgi:integrase
MIKWTSTREAGVRYREHQDRKHLGKLDRYFAIRYYHDGKQQEEGCGWSSEGWNATKASNLRNELANNNRQGIRPMSLKEKRQQDTDAREAQLQAEVQAVEEQAALEKSNVTFEHLFEIYITHAKQNKKSWADDEGRYIFNIKEFIGNRLAKDVTTFDLEKMKNILKKRGKAPKTIHHSLSLVRTVFNKCSLWGAYTGGNPAIKVQYPKIADNDRVRFLSFDEVKILLDELSKLPKIETHDLVLMAAFTGARYLEIASLKWVDIDLESGYINFLNTKNGRSRTVFVPVNVQNVLSGRKPVDCSPDSLVFPTNQGTIRGEVPNSFPEIANRLFNQGVSDRRQRVCFHTLRHSYISWLIMSGADLRTVQQISGHETMAMLKRYSHLTGAHLQKAADRVAAAFDADCKDNVISFADRKAV